MSIETDGSDPAALIGPEKHNDVSMALRRIRAVIVERAKATGIDEEWLTRWWHHLDASAAAFDGVEW